ncbi:hypothetical protein GW17_00056428 [Ensete ventricosum]|nr:hypothetical protein GW17_00056428 [Ensete ventricosum]RZS17350.1 hypothetical protein BHM03_00049487 [Ensete ventricosum]
MTLATGQPPLPKRVDERRYPRVAPPAGGWAPCLLAADRASGLPTGLCLQTALSHAAALAIAGHPTGGLTMGGRSCKGPTHKWLPPSSRPSL